MDDTEGCLAAGLRAVVESLQALEVVKLLGFDLELLVLHMILADEVDKENPAVLLLLLVTLVERYAVSSRNYGQLASVMADAMLAVTE